MEWLRREALAALDTARAIGAVHLANDAMVLLGNSLGICVDRLRIDYTPEEAPDELR
jgi:hypothetical protein